MFLLGRGPWALLIGALLGFLLCPGACRRHRVPEIEVFCFTRTVRVDQVCRGLQKVLKVPQLHLREAEGNWRRGQDLVSQLAKKDLSLLIVLGTPALSLVAPKIKRQPVVFGMVADPYFTGAAYDRRHPEEHQENITGIASPPPLSEALRQGARLFPHYRRWGLLFDPLEGSSIEISHQFACLAPKFNLTPIVQAASSETEARASLTAWLGQGVRVVYLPPDQNARRYARLVLQWGRERKLLVVNGHPDFQDKGAILSVTTNYEALGKLVAALANRVLAGEPPRTIPIQHETPIHLAVNERLLEQWSGYPPGKVNISIKNLDIPNAVDLRKR